MPEINVNKNMRRKLSLGLILGQFVLWILFGPQAISMAHSSNIPSLVNVGLKAFGMYLVELLAMWSLMAVPLAVGILIAPRS